MSSTERSIHHIAVLTARMDACVRWYTEFFGCVESWTLDTFSPLSQRRLPGLSRVTELAADGLRFHLFTCDGGRHEPPGPQLSQFQHVCISVASPEALRSWRDRWFELLPAYQDLFAHAEPASEIDVDARGVHSFYARDINGLEFEFSYLPEGNDEP